MPTKKEIRDKFEANYKNHEIVFIDSNEKNLDNSDFKSFMNNKKSTKTTTIDDIKIAYQVKSAPAKGNYKPMVTYMIVSKLKENGMHKKLSLVELSSSDEKDKKTTIFKYMRNVKENLPSTPDITDFNKTVDIMDKNTYRLSGYYTVKTRFMVTPTALKRWTFNKGDILCFEIDKLGLSRVSYANNKRIIEQFQDYDSFVFRDLGPHTSVDMYNSVKHNTSKISRWDVVKYINEVINNFSTKQNESVNKLQENKLRRIIKEEIEKTLKEGTTLYIDKCDSFLNQLYEDVQEFNNKNSGTSDFTPIENNVKKIMHKLEEHIDKVGTSVNKLRNK